MINPTFFPPALRGDDAPNSGDAEGLPLPVSILADGPLAAMAETGLQVKNKEFQLAMKTSTSNQPDMRSLLRLRKDMLLIGH